MKDLQDSLNIANKRIMQLENRNNSHDDMQQKQHHHCTSTSQGHSEVGEMKLWFLEQKVRQMELDIHKNNTELQIIKINHRPVQQQQ